MEVLLVVGSGLMMGAAALALSGGGALSGGSALRWALRLGMRLSRTLERLGGSRIARAALGIPVVRDLARDVARRTSARGARLDEGAALVALAGAIALVGVLAGAVLASPVAGAAAACAAAGAQVARGRAQGRRVRREVASAMPGIYRTLSVALGSGQTLAQAVAYVGSHERGPAAEVFARMSLRLRCGSSTEEAVNQLARELSVPGAELLAAALVISHRTGSPLRELLMRSASLAERQGEFERLLGVKTAQVRLSVRIVCLMPAIMICVLALVSPDFQEGLLTPVGLGCVALAAALDGVALLLIRRLVSGVL